MQAITVPIEVVQDQFTVKGSKFIGTIFPINSEDDAHERLVEMRKKYYDATHNCSAYRIHPEIERSSDDGEPSGSAGNPILQAIRGRDLSNVIVIVTRYFGGTKLGVGGLVRAYGDAAARVVEKVGVVQLYPVLVISCSLSFRESATLYQLIDRFPEAKICNETYDEDGAVFNVKILKSKLAAFSELLQERLNRNPELVVEEEKLDKI